MDDNKLEDIKDVTANARMDIKKFSNILQAKSLNASHFIGCMPIVPLPLSVFGFGLGFTLRVKGRSRGCLA
jgi:hypothetical protein